VLPVPQVVAHAAYVNNKTKSNSSPLRFAVKNSHLRASEVLIKTGGADCLVTDSQVGAGCLCRPHRRPDSSGLVGLMECAQ
jgi:hypothetical protein